MRTFASIISASQPREVKTSGRSMCCQVTNCTEHAHTILYANLIFSVWLLGNTLYYKITVETQENPKHNTWSLQVKGTQSGR